LRYLEATKEFFRRKRRSKTFKVIYFVMEIFSKKKTTEMRKVGHWSEENKFKTCST
jgi:hypothetical protein